MKKWMKITFGVIGGIILLFIVDLVCVFTIHRPLLAIKKDNGSVYKGILYDTYNCAEYSVPQIKLKGTKFTCLTNDNYKDIQEDDEHSFFGHVVESHQSYLIVEPNEGEKERNSSDKFHIDLKDANTTYKVGTNVKITYVGGINETYPAKIGTTKIELESKIKEDVLKKINSIAENGPSTSSNPFDYINASKNIYNELLDNPKETFMFAISDLIENNANSRNGLTSYIEALLCSKINTNFKYDFESSSDYLEKYKEFLFKCDCIYNEYDLYAKSLLE